MLLMAAAIAYGPILKPPARWDHPFHGQVIERVVDPSEVNKLCSQLAGGRPIDALACSNTGTVIKGANLGAKICIIVIPTGPLANAARHHEIAHCNGWNQSHSN